MHEALIDRRIDEFHHQKLNCAEVVLLTAGEILGVSGAFCPRIATPFGGGLAGTQHTCGALSGALMVVGLIKGRELGGDKAPAYAAGKDFMQWFQGRFGSCACRSLIELDLDVQADREAFRAPGGRHETVCEPMARAVIEELIARFGR